MKREGDQRSWWRDSAEIFSFYFRFHIKNPSVSTKYALWVSFQGSLICKVLKLQY
ncbi:hypothetical protein RUMCAL_02086 [Ruminococcus callidus ATCC 27760]|uniref:Uncharacterized protein n=1 Tax=Ruminococcus callidus ATCC 27760 TaxID=411473 RepID=U2M525_9FIRM|nr:hypothetical protein RUMCAL_02086 [Ruminococcus callidus ATCC 27760]